MTSRLLKVRNKLEKKYGNKTILERMENSMFKWYGHVVHMVDNRGPKQIMTRSLGGR